MTNEWIEWVGGPCPVAPNTVVEVKFRDGNWDECHASYWTWNNEDAADDIIAYRVVEQKPAEQDEPVAWVDRLDTARPRCVTNLDCRSVTEAKLGIQYIPLFTHSPDSAKEIEKAWDEFRALSVRDGAVIAGLQAKVQKLEEQRTFALSIKDKREAENYALHQQLTRANEVIEQCSSALMCEALIYRDNDPEDGEPESMREALAAIRQYREGK